MFGESIAADLKRRDVIDVLDEISDGVSGIQANRCHSLISAVWKWSQREHIITDDPSHNIAKRGQEVQRDRVLTQDELRRLWKKLGDDATDRVLKLLLLLGQRRSEVAKARATELRDDAWQIPADRTKNSLAHIVPLTPLARELFGSGFDLYPTTLPALPRPVGRCAT